MSDTDFNVIDDDNPAKTYDEVADAQMASADVVSRAVDGVRPPHTSYLNPKGSPLGHGTHQLPAPDVSDETGAESLFSGAGTEGHPEVVVQGEGDINAEDVENASEEDRQQLADLHRLEQESKSTLVTQHEGRTVAVPDITEGTDGPEIEGERTEVEELQDDGTLEPLGDSDGGADDGEPDTAGDHEPEGEPDPRSALTKTAEIEEAYTADELHAEATLREIEGRSDLDKHGLALAIAEARRKEA